MSDYLPMSEDDVTRPYYPFIVDNMDVDELEGLAYEIGVDPDGLDGDLVDEMAESLLRFLARHSDLQILDVALRDLYPVQYGRAFGDDMSEEAGLADEPPPDYDGYHHDPSNTDLVRVPGGTFKFGEEPAEIIDLSEFYVGRSPISNAEYKLFLDANPGYPVPYVDEGWAWPYNWDREARLYPSDKMEHPVVLVSWEDALAFCRWAGLRLPTEQEWEKAARGVDLRRYPWGDGRPDERAANYDGAVGETAPVMSYSPEGDSPYGAADMAGNVWEWTASHYELPADRGNLRVARGGAWDSEASEVETTFRVGLEPDLRAANVGFRVAK
jgi:hypothetical protein